MPAAADRVAQLLEDIRAHDTDRYALVQALREAVLGLDASVTEEVKYGGILFTAGRPFCGIFSYTQHASVEFSEGAALPDPHGVLEGAGKGRRHIKLVSVQDIAARHVAQYLGLAFKAAAKA